ncbi:predicted protein [Naegleria gruberi]|uniref:Predicted protein n=1 Tax=Naegleria gruberi TaxID=5762 RepID=D2V0Q0_NAEGR|nr:uncharacterized protein NAEGRDRAFT_62371 [Naegleria gruberi]EFC49557.1 predicted protein [Naegleria gruberi]|eukprot:XP_002682301.1 predicted protein [Naegleria gruberi strain NEG-M]
MERLNRKPHTLKHTPQQLFTVESFHYEKLRKEKEEQVALELKKLRKEKKEKEKLAQENKELQRKLEMIEREKLFKLEQENELLKKATQEVKQEEKKQDKQETKLKRKVNDEEVSTPTKKTKTDPTITVVNNYYASPSSIETKKQSSPKTVATQEGCKHKRIYDQFIYIYCSMTGQKPKEFIDNPKQVQEFITFFELKLKPKTLVKNFKPDPNMTTSDYQEILFYLLNSMKGKEGEKKQDEVISGILKGKLKSKFNKELVPYLIAFAYNNVEGKKQLQGKMEDFLNDKTKVDSFIKTYNLDLNPETNKPYLKAETISNNKAKIMDIVKNPKTLKDLLNEACKEVIQRFFGSPKTK